MSRSSPTAPRDQWADIVLCGETNADRQSIEKARTAIQRSRDLLALANYLRPEIKRKSSRLERDDFSEARTRFQPLLQVIP